MPPDLAVRLTAVSVAVTYGWGMVPAQVSLGGTTWTTSRGHRAGGYVVPLEDVVRRAEGVELEDVVEVRLVVSV